MSESQPVILLATNHSYMFYRFRKQLIEGLLPYYSVVLSTPFVGHEQDLADLGITLLPIELDRRSVSPKKDLALLREYGNLLEKVRPDLVLTFSIKPNVYLGMQCARRKIPYFTHVQGLGTAFQKPLLKQAAKILYHTGLRKAEAVFFENQVNRDFFLSQKIISEEKPVLLSGAGIDLDYVSYQPYPENDIIHILYLGRIMQEKGIDELLSSLSHLHDKGISFVFDFAGFYEDSYKEALDTMCQAGYAIDHGFVEDPRELVAASDVVVLPSWHEGMSNVLLEAAAAGRPLIATDIPGCRESIEDGISGFLVGLKDQAALEQAIEKMISLSRQEREAMGKAGRLKMEREFSREEVVIQTISVLHKAEIRTSEQRKKEYA